MRKFAISRRCTGDFRDTLSAELRIQSRTEKEERERERGVVGRCALSRTSANFGFILCLQVITTARAGPYSSDP